MATVNPPDPVDLVVGAVSTLPPVACGLATFNDALVKALRSHGVVVRRVDAGASQGGAHDVVAELGDGSPGELVVAAAALDDGDVMVVQHEYGIYPGADGDAVVDLVRRVRVPVVVVAHTVLEHPTVRQRTIMKELLEAATTTVVMTAAARWRLLRQYDADADAVVVIPHGASVSTCPYLPAGGPWRC